MTLRVTPALLLQPSFVSEAAAPGRSALNSVEVAYGRQVSPSEPNGTFGFLLQNFLLSVNRGSVEVLL